MTVPAIDQTVILCGLGQLGRRVLDYLHAAGVPVVVIDDRCDPDRLGLKNVRVIRGDFRVRDVLVDAGLAHARGVVIATSNDLVNISATLLVRHLDPDVRVVVRLFNQNLIPRLGKAVRNVVALSVSHLTAPMLAQTALTGQSLGTFTIDDRRSLIAEITVTPQSSLDGVAVSAIQREHRTDVVAHFPVEGVTHYLQEVNSETRLRPGDRLVIHGEPQNLEPLLENASGDSSPHLRWASWLRRHARALWQTVRDVDPLVKAWSIVLLFILVGGTVVYYLWIGKSFAFSLLRSVSVVATGDDLHPEELPDGWAMVFVSAFRVAGAVVMAAFTAFLTNYLLRARLRGALEIRRMPDGGHVIVCGLGNIGFRLIEELARYGERVVVIESQRDGRFMAAARRHNVAIIVGDATVLDVLRQANAATARAVVAATNDELANIEIALLTREINSKQRVVVRLNDPQLSEMLRESANIGLALSLPDLAAPAFMAALFGDRVLSVFMVHRRLMAAVELLVSSDDVPLIGQRVRAVAIDYNMLPVGLRNAAGQPLLQPLDHRLAEGDRLTALFALDDLSRLLRREPVPTTWSVFVTGFKPHARSRLIQLMRERNDITAEAGDSLSTNLPVCVAAELTRGQAEDLHIMLSRDEIASQCLTGDHADAASSHV